MSASESELGSATSPEVTGGSGFAFEDCVSATYLASVLADGGARGLPEAVARRVLVQRAALGHPLDDLIVEGEDRQGNAARLSLQAKQRVVVSDAPSNDDFRQIVQRSWTTFTDSSFRPESDRIGAATARVAQDAFRSVRTTCEWARLSTDAIDFFARVAIPNFASDAQRLFVDESRNLIREVDPSIDDDRLWRFLRHFVLLRFDVLAEGAEQDAESIDRLRPVLAHDDPARASELWTALLKLARDMSSAAGSIDRSVLISRLGSAFRFVASPVSGRDLRRLAEAADHALADIRDDIAGRRFTRVTLLDEARELLKTHRVLHITGEPGTGKSVLLRMLAQEQRATGFALVLKADRLVGPGWTGMAQHLRLETDRLVDLLTELAAVSDSVLYVDGLDRVPKEAQSTIRDVFRAVLMSPGLERWRVVATLRDSNIEHVRTWLREELLNPGHVGTLSVPAFSDAEAEQIAVRLPMLRPMLFGTSQVREIARRAFFLDVLAGRGAGPAIPTGSQPRTEPELLALWWRGGGYDADPASARARQTVLHALAERGGRTLGQEIEARGVDPVVVQSLIDDGILRDDDEGQRLWFRHDIFFEWSLFHVCRGLGEDWFTVIRDAGELPAMGRVVELLSQTALERQEGWADHLERIERTAARSQWNRAWLLAPFSSPRLWEFRTMIDEALLPGPQQRLGKLLVWFQAVRTVENPLVISGEIGSGHLDQFSVLHLADALAWPRETGSWQRMIAWLLSVKDRLTPDVLPDFLSVVEVWLNAFGDYGGQLTRQIAETLSSWLTDVETINHRAVVGHASFDAAVAAKAKLRFDEDFEHRLRTLLFRAASATPDLVSAYLIRVATSERILRAAFADIVTYSPRLAGRAPKELVECCLSELLDALPAEKVESRQDGLIGWSPSTHDWHSPSISAPPNLFHPASPIREPFRSLLRYAPAEGLRLIRTLCTHAMEAWRQLHKYDWPQKRERSPLPLELQFPWGKERFWGHANIYVWFRGGFADEVIGSALMTLEDWAFSQVESGRDVDEVIRDVVSGNECVAVLGIAITLALHSNRASPTTQPLASNQRLWVYDIHRFVTIDQSGMNSNEIAASWFEKDTVHLPELKRINARRERKLEVRSLAMMFALGPDSPVRDEFVAALRQFPQQLPLDYDDEREDEAHLKYLRDTAEIWAELSNRENYSAAPTPDGSAIQVSFENPKAGEPRVQAALARTAEMERWLTPFNWAVRAIKEGHVDDGDVAAAVERAKALEGEFRFEDQSEAGGDYRSYGRSGVAGTAAAAVSYGKSIDSVIVDWAREVLFRAAKTPAGRGSMGRELYHPAMFAASGLGALIRSYGAGLETKRTLLQLAAHPIADVSMTALGHAMGSWRQDPLLAWTALRLGLELSIGKRPSERRRGTQDEVSESAKSHSPRPTEALERAMNALESSGNEDFSLPEVPPAWVIIPNGEDPTSTLGVDPDVYLREDFARELLRHVPLDFLLSDERRKAAILAQAELLLAWTIDRYAPSWANGRTRRHDRPRPPIQWMYGFMNWLGQIGAHISSEDVHRRFLVPMFAMPEDSGLELLEQFVRLYVCGAVIDAETVEPAAIDVLVECLTHISGHRDWQYVRRQPSRHLSGGLRSIIRAILAVDWDEQAPGAKRFANGEWTSVHLLSPATNYIVSKFGDAPEILSAYLVHVERGFSGYRLEEFLSQLQRLPANVWESREAWSYGNNAARLAALVQRFAERQRPIVGAILSSLLQILDRLVDVGDRRSAALQVSDLFRPTRGAGTRPLEGAASRNLPTTN